MNLKSLANLLGMSKTTVSRALNGYQANPMARGLAMGRTNVFGIIYPPLPADLGDPMFLDVVSGMSEALEKIKRNLIIAPVSPQNEQASYVQVVRDRRVDGLVVGRTLVHDERIAFLSKVRFPFVAHGRTRIDAPYAWFDYDNAAGIRMAVECLLAHGHRRIAMISAPLELNFACQRSESFLAAMSDVGLAIDPRYLVADTLDRRSGHHAML